MKIAFFCSCLEPGKDGVGDYIRQLASACAEQTGGINWLVALNDGDLPEGESDRVEAQGSLQVYRLSSRLSWAERIARLAPKLEQFGPDWVSFHYVPFAFHPRGLARDWPEALDVLFRGRSLHWMFHELWVGAYVGAPWKERLLGWMQRRGVRGVVQRWQPKCVHSSNPGYVALLADAGIPARRLGMFGTIPRADPALGGDEWFRNTMATAGFAFGAEERDSLWFGLFFGTLHANWPHEPLFGLLREAAVRQKKKVVILSVGYLRTGSELWSRMQQSYGDHFKFVLLGEKNRNDLSQLLATVDFGLTSSPSNILGKSSAVATMMEHGLPVVTNWEGLPLRLKAGRTIKKDENPLIWAADEALPGKLKTLDRRGRQHCQELPGVARQLLRDLGHS